MAEGFQLAPKDGDEAPVALALRGIFAGNSPDLAQDDSVSDLMSIYSDITGRPPTVDNRATSGPEGGTCLAFVQSAMEPVTRINKSVTKITPKQMRRLYETRRPIGGA